MSVKLLHHVTAKLPPSYRSGWLAIRGSGPIHEAEARHVRPVLRHTSYSDWPALNAQASQTCVGSVINRGYSDWPALKANLTNNQILIP
jgi:hypothetical protein